MPQDETTTVPVKVRWKGKTLPNLEINTSEPPEVFKLQIFSLTSIPPDRQTLLGFKGGSKLKDDSDWNTLGLKKGMKIMLMGTPATEETAADTQRIESLRNKTKFKVRNDLVENSLDEQYFQDIPTHPPGLINLGNTCYMNSTIQCLKSVGGLRKMLREYKGSSSAMNPNERLTAGLRDLLSRLNTPNAARIDPMGFLAILRRVNPVFAERTNRGVPMQQDAEECWSQILTTLSTALSARNVQGQKNGEEGENPVDRMFAIEMKAEDRCEESENEPVIERKETVRSLKCHISKNVNHLHQGIKENLEETIEKHSDALERTAKWKRTSQIAKLPPYLIVQLVRFFWKASESVKAKILRQVNFPINLDLYDFCTDDLKKELSKHRKSDDDMEVEKKDASEKVDTEEKKDSSSDPSAASAASSASADASNGSQQSESIQFEQSGIYELCAVLTHKGRAADTGHYVAWVKDDEGKWLKYDDDKVSVHTEEDVKKLGGGGDWHMAYMCLYRAKGLKS